MCKVFQFRYKYVIIMNDGIFSQDWYKFFNQSSMNDFLKMSQGFKKFGLTPKDVYSIPLTIQNLLNEFKAYCQKNVDEILYFQRKFYRF